jgi:hypothetical protein
VLNEATKDIDDKFVDPLTQYISGSMCKEDDVFDFHW